MLKFFITLNHNHNPHIYNILPNISLSSCLSTNFGIWLETFEKNYDVLVKEAL